MSRGRKNKAPKRVLRLPDLDYAKGAVLNPLGSPESKRAYQLTIDDFVIWYCSEPRLAFNKTVVLRYRLELEARRLAPATINLRLAAVRRLAYEAADTGLLSPDLAAGIRRVKGAKKIGVRLGKWLTAEQSRSLLRTPNAEGVKGRRDMAIFEQTFVATAKTQKMRTVLVSFPAQTILVVIGILIPMIYFDALPSAQLRSLLLTPPPLPPTPPTPPPEAPKVVKFIPRQFDAGKLMALQRVLPKYHDD